MTPIMRVPDQIPSNILNYIDRGIKAITVPFVNTKEELEAVVDCCYFMPRGHRSFTSNRVSRFGFVKDLKKIINSRNSLHKVIAKIEKPEAIKNINAIIDASDAIMVARGDLGVEVPPQKVPVYQKMIVNKCIMYAKPVIIATQMLDSMTDSPTATRAEVNDVANSVIYGADALMLSGETSAGKHPLKAVNTMRKIIRDIEASDHNISKNTEDR